MNNIPARVRDVAMVFQNYALYPHMSVAENIAFGLKMRKVDSKVIRERVETVAHSLSLENLLDRKPKQLSGGQQQRVALGRAIARQPQVFLLDEPLSNLDAQLRNDTRAELKELHHNIGITTVYVTHDQVEAMTLADKIVVLSGGHIQQIGEPQDIYAHPANRMVASFLGNPPMNIIPAKYAAAGFDVDGQLLTISENIKNKLRLSQGQKIDLGIRPEDIQINEESQAELQVEVKLVEPLGRETLIRVAVLGTAIILNVQISGNIRFHVGDKLNLQLDLQKLFLFDSVSGDRLYP